MPPTLQWLLWASAAVIALSTIWSKFVRPVSKLVAYLQQILPLLAELKEQFKDSPNSLEVLKEIAGQFRTDSGSSLRDVVNRLEEAAIQNKVAAQELKVKAEVLEVGVAAVKALAVTDREDAAHRLTLLEKLLAEFKESRNSADLQSTRTGL